jgi:hypothetical protein
MEPGIAHQLRRFEPTTRQNPVHLGTAGMGAKRSSQHLLACLLSDSVLLPCGLEMVCYQHMQLLPMACMYRYAYACMQALPLKGCREGVVNVVAWLLPAVQQEPHVLSAYTVSHRGLQWRVGVSWPHMLGSATNISTFYSW